MTGAGEPDRLRAAEEREAELRRRLGELLVDQRRALAERARYEQRARLEGADPRVAAAASAEDQRAAELAAAVDAVRDGRIVAVKGLGGFHLVADACHDATVMRLRARKRREEKPFA
ncbi:MAG TPA: Sua5/YciO/YrdC/YwlC family protein, partial [Acidimicrobiia bacterium]|nr:Sua5/YciO/YrdC/YwlC family protein [Acidimicrobiia bacterium]